MQQQQCFHIQKVNNDGVYVVLLVKPCHCILLLAITVFWLVRSTL